MNVQGSGGELCYSPILNLTFHADSIKECSISDYMQVSIQDKEHTEIYSTAYPTRNLDIVLDCGLLGDVTRSYDRRSVAYPTVRA